MSERGMGGLPLDLTPDGAPGRPFEKGQYGYLVESGEWSFTPADTVFDKPAEKGFHVSVYGPYSDIALAEQALDQRIKNHVTSGFATVTEQMQPYARGLRGPHGGIVSWKRDVTFRDRTGVFGDQEGWQQIRLVYVDEMP